MADEMRINMDEIDIVQKDLSDLNKITETKMHEVNENNFKKHISQIENIFNTIEISMFLRQNNISLDCLCDKLEITKPTYYHWIKKRKLKNIKRLKSAINEILTQRNITDNGCEDNENIKLTNQLIGLDVYTKYIKLLEEKVELLQKENRDLKSKLINRPELMQ